MATHKGGRGQRSGEYRKRDGWSSPRERDFHKPGSSSPGPRRSNSPWHYRPDGSKEYREQQHRRYAKYLNDEWKKVEPQLTAAQKIEGDQRVDCTVPVEFVAKTPADMKDEELFNVELYLKNREDKPASPD